MKSIYFDFFVFTALVVQVRRSDGFSGINRRASNFRGIQFLATKDDNEGYKFGDFTRNFIRKVSGNEQYELGDAMRGIDKTIKKSVANASGKSDYQFGDLSRLLDKTVKDQVNAFTGKEEYAIGDVSKEIIRRVGTHDYTLEDIVILLKVLLALGSSLSPIASFLPAKLLIELLDYSIAGDLSNKIIEAVSKELDRRVKKSLTGDENYQLGDLTKRAIMQYIGKERYSFGDITRKAMEDKKNYDAKSLIKDMSTDVIQRELAAWDRKFIEEKKR